MKKKYTKRNEKSIEKSISYTSKDPDPHHIEHIIRKKISEEKKRKHTKAKKLRRNAV